MRSNAPPQKHKRTNSQIGEFCQTVVRLSYDFRPGYAKKGFNRAIYASITNEINYQIAQLRKQGLEPTLVRLGLAASSVYTYEQWAKRIDQAPTHHKGHRCLVPIRYRDPQISGILVEGKSKHPPSRPP